MVYVHVKHQGQLTKNNPCIPAHHSWFQLHRQVAVEVYLVAPPELYKISFVGVGVMYR